MMKTWILSLLFCFACASLHSQTSTVAPEKSELKDAIFFELGGAGGSHSLNYERRFNMPNLFDFTLRSGFGLENYTDFRGGINPNFVIPMMAGITYGNNHKIELGVGQSYSNTVHADNNTGYVVRQGDFSTTFLVGYRYHFAKKNLFIKVGYMPLIEFNLNFQHWAGTSIGFIF